jgi:hypothetical protein
MWWSASRWVDLVRVHRKCDQELMGARNPAEVFAGTAGGRAVVLGGTDGDGRGRSCPRRVPAGCRGDRMPVPRRGAGRMGSWQSPQDRWAGRSGSAAASPLPGCAVTHVLLPVTVFSRRAYAAEQIWAALTARTDDCWRWLRLTTPPPRPGPYRDRLSLPEHSADRAVPLSPLLGATRTATRRSACRSVRRSTRRGT